ncbi:anti-sigma factor [Bacillus sp. KH172YL63]|uniref:anti-sigma factor n=1 Tax=Bacillus sp. KH172YL63 TaxID=2709784 RepID=UPI0013E50D54|nr:anti-sigma factor [Bacillus sp. KH172YL63]BCB02428.1 hypothetical protein KH172YL63_05610 [Bacillus sp. KH172YL63]
MTAQPCDNLLDYYNGHLSQLERKHLSTWIFELRQLAEYLPYASDTVQPPEDLEDRVMASILGEEKKASFDTPIPARSVAALIGNAYLYTQIEDQEKVIQQATIDQVEQYVELAAVSGNAKGTASIIKQGTETSMVIQAADLQKLSNDEVYQVWLIKDDQPERAGTFVPSKDGKGSVIFKFNEAFTEKDWDTVAITLEPDANSQLPQGDIVLASEI